MMQATLRTLKDRLASFTRSQSAPMATSDLTLYIFHHDSADISQGTGCLKSDPRVEFVNLDTLPLPDGLTIKKLSVEKQRAAFAEYLGLMHVKPRREMIACFPYTMPCKFSYAWAHLSRSPHYFLPQFDFHDVLATRYQPNCLYATELSNFRYHYADFVADLHHNFNVGKRFRPSLGPMKGSFIVSSKEFYRFQKWLRTVASYLVNNFDLNDFAHISSPYSSAPLPNRSKRDPAHDAIRHGLGNVLERATAYYFAQRFDRCHKKLIGPVVQSNRNTGHLQSMLQRHAIDKTIYVVFGNSKYKHIIDNWIVAAEKQKIFNFMIVALDTPLYERLRKAGIPTVLEECPPSLKDVWIRRVRLLREIVESGFSVIHSDADAVILRDPTPYLEDDESDFIFTQGTIWPPDVFNKWGFVLCCGFFKINATDRAKNVLRSVEADVLSTKDDQLSFNRILASEISSFQEENFMYFRFKGQSVRWCPKTMCGRSDTVAISVLPHNLFQRIHSANDNVIVKHIYSPKTSGGTKKILIESGCWFLPRSSTTRTKLAKYVRFRALT